MDFKIAQNPLTAGQSHYILYLRQDKSRCRKSRVRLARLWLSLCPIMKLVLEAPGTCHNSTDASPARLRWMHIQLVPLSLVVVFCYQTYQFALLKEPRRNFDQHFW
jgi:hypothetical protein